jgi:hypothetical protein
MDPVATAKKHPTIAADLAKISGSRVFNVKAAHALLDNWQAQRRSRHVGVYTAEQWRAIIDSLAAVYVDIDMNVIVDEQQETVRTLLLPLAYAHRDALRLPMINAKDQQHHQSKIKRDIKTLRLPMINAKDQQRHQSKIKRDIKTLEAAIEVLEKWGYVPIVDAGNGRTILTRVIRFLRIGLTKGRDRRLAPHDEFWRELLKIWHLVVPKRIGNEHMRLRDFLFACSAPLYQTKTTAMATSVATSSTITTSSPTRTTPTSQEQIFRACENCISDQRRSAFRLTRSTDWLRRSSSANRKRH